MHRSRKNTRVNAIRDLELSRQQHREMSAIADQIVVACYLEIRQRCAIVFIKNNVP